MDIEKVREICLSLENVEECLPFDENTLVYKVHGKMFALLTISENSYFNVKCNPEQAIELRERYSFVTPGFHMNKKHWNTINYKETNVKQLEEWIRDSYELVLMGIPRSKRVVKG